VRELAGAQVVRAAVEAEADAGERLVAACAGERVLEHARAQRSGGLREGLRARDLGLDADARDRLAHLGGAELRARCQACRDAQHGAQLADVAGPGVEAQAHGGLAIERRPARELAQEGVGEEREIVEPLAQRRHAQHPVLEQAIVEIGPQETALDQRTRLGVRRRDDRRVAPQRARATEPAQLPALDPAQHLRLVRERHRRDLVEEQDPAARALRGAGTIQRAGEGAARRAEQLALEVIGGHRWAVEHLDVSGSPARDGGQRRRDQLLARAGLADHQRAAPRRCREPGDLGAQPADRLRLAEDGVKAPRRGGAGSRGGQHHAKRPRQEPGHADRSPRSSGGPARRLLVAALQPDGDQPPTPFR